MSVRVCAPVEFRVRVLVERLGNADAKAVREEIEHHDAIRTRTMATYFNVEREDARHHLVLNTERLTIEACVKTIVQRADTPRFRGPMTVRSALADELLDTMIGSAMAEELSPSMAPLGVSVFGGERQDHAARNKFEWRLAPEGRNDRPRGRGPHSAVAASAGILSFAIAFRQGRPLDLLEPVRPDGRRR
jgi:hypothetical protein